MQKRLRQVDLSQRSAVRSRSGIVIFWVIIIAPALLFLLGAIVDISRVWLARIELTNALEAAALSGVKTWGEAGTGGNTSAQRQSARTHAQTTASANTVIGQNSGSPQAAVVVSLDRNETSGSGPNDNTSPTGELVLGQIISSGSTFTFNASSAPTANNQFAVRTNKTVTIYSIWSNLIGIPVGPYQITSGAVAWYDSTQSQPRIVPYLP